MLTGDCSPLAFAVLFSLRSLLGRHRALSLFTLLAIATSIALATGLEMATRSVELELARTADALAGAARLEVSAGGAGVPEALLPGIAAAEGVAAASPLVVTTFRVPLPDGSRIGLRVLGVDFLSDQDVRGYTLEDSDVEVRDELRLISELDSVIVTRALAERLGLGLGERLPVLSPAGPLQLMIRGILRPGGIADAYGSQIAAMDVYTLQEHLGRRGIFDRIDVVPEPGADLAALERRLAALVQGVAEVRRPESRDEFSDRVFGTVSAGLWAIACIGVLAAGLLCYGALSLSVDARMREFALLQAAGLEARRVRRMVRIDVALLSALGAGLGLALGRLLGEPFLASLARISAENDGVQLHLHALEIRPTTLAVALGIAAAVSLAASLEPARRATSRPPLEVLRGESNPGRHPLRGLPLALLLLGAALLPLPLPAALRVGWTYLAGIAALIAATRPLVLPLLARALRAAQDAIPSAGAFLGQSLLARPAQTAGTLGVIAAVVSGLVAIRIVLSSIEASFLDWVGSRYRGGLVITAGDPYDRAQRDPLSAATVRAIREAAGEDAVLESVNAPIRFRGEEVILFAREMGVLAERGRLAVLGRDWPEVARALAAGGIAVSDAFSRRFAVAPGDRIALDTPRGPRAFEVAAIVRDYYGPSGSLHLDLAEFDASWTRAGASSVVVWPRGDDEARIAAIRRAVGERQLLFFTRSDDHARWVMRPFQRFVRLLDLVSAFTLLLGGFAILTLMAGAVRQRAPELASLRIAGATGRGLAALVVADSLILVAFGALAGILLGIACSRPMCALLADWLGWTVEWSPAWQPLAGIAALALASSLLFSLYPALLARRTALPFAALAE